jgi:hypothetical protein
MIKIQKTRKTSKTRKMRKRSRKGGDTLQTLASIKIKNNKILADVEQIEDGNGECNLSEIKEFATDEAKLINELIEEEQLREKSSLERENEPDVPLMQQVISIDGFNGTVGELIGKMREKIGQLKQNTGNAYKSYIDKLDEVTQKISSETYVNTNKIKEILKAEQVTFKNNKLMGGKTKKRRGGGRKSKRHTKRR